MDAGCVVHESCCETNEQQGDSKTILLIYGYWVSPEAEERPTKASQVEGGCYW